MLKEEMILTLARDIPILSTDQAAIYFRENGSPSKRASEVLKRLEKKGLMEGRSREVGKSKLWRLTAEGRRLAGVDRAPVPLNSMKVDHILSVGDFYQSVQETLEGWQYEPRFEFAHGVYCPDALFKMKDRGFALEVQRSPLSSQRWAAKWAVASAFFDTLKVKPTILVLSNQSPETINCGSFLKIIIKRLDNVRE